MMYNTDPAEDHIAIGGMDPAWIFMRSITQIRCKNLHVIDNTDPM